jgi:hypothetical protein
MIIYQGDDIGARNDADILTGRSRGQPASEVLPGLRNR